MWDGNADSIVDHLEAHGLASTDGDAVGETVTFLVRPSEACV